MAETDEKVEAAEEADEIEEKGDEKVEKEDEHEVPTRERPWDKREARAEFFKTKNAEKSKAKAEAEDDDEELTPQARKLLERELKPLSDEVSHLRDEIAFRDYFSEHPEDRKFEKAARARYEAWPNTPVAEIMKTLRPSISAEKKAETEEKATRGKMGGSGVRAQEEKPAQTQKELEEVYRKVKRGETGQALKSLGIK